MAQIEIDACINQCMYYTRVSLADEVQFEDDKQKIIATHIPLGVVAAICPWNFPLILSSIKVFSSIVTGNCVIVKPSPFTPYCVLKWVELARGILPPGVFQALNGGADLGAAMTSHPGIDKISFTGTIATGKKVMAACAKTLKKVTLELAGNDAAVVTADIDIPTVAAKVATGGFFNAGQMCVATKRVYVHGSIYDEFLDALVKEVEKGYTIQEDATTPGVFGPLDNKMQYDVVKGMLEDCRQHGYKIRTGGKVREKGFWLEPTVVEKPSEDAPLVKEEQFGESPSVYSAELLPERFTDKTRSHPTRHVVVRRGRCYQARQSGQRRTRSVSLLQGPGQCGEDRSETGGRQCLHQPEREAEPGCLLLRVQGQWVWW